MFLAKRLDMKTFMQPQANAWIAIVINHQDVAMNEAILHRLMKITNLRFFVKVCIAVGS